MTAAIIPFPSGKNAQPAPLPEVRRLTDEDYRWIMRAMIHDIADDLGIDLSRAREKP